MFRVRIALKGESRVTPGCTSLWLKAQASFFASRKYSVVRNSEVSEVWVPGVASDHHGEGKYYTKKGCVNSVLSLSD